MPFEDWESDQGTSKTKLAILLLILVIAAVASFRVVDAVYRITSPPSDSVSVSVPATLSKPEVSMTSAVVGDTITISSTLSDSMAGVQVFFYENGSDIGSDFTDDTGTASYTRTFTVPGTFTYVADCVHP